MTMNQSLHALTPSALSRSPASGAHGLRITETAQRLGATTRALRYYEDQRLVTPGRTAGGMRIYGPATRERLQMILTFRRLGVPVATIREALKTGPGELADVLRRRLRDLETEQRLLHDTLATMTPAGLGTPGERDPAWALLRPDPPLR